jgi:hypothetical protein
MLKRIDSAGNPTFFSKVRKLAAMPFWAMHMRLRGEAHKFLNRQRNHTLVKRVFNPSVVLARFGYVSPDDLYNDVDANTSATLLGVPVGPLENIFSDEMTRIISLANKIMTESFEILGAKDVKASEINWAKDYLSGYEWPNKHFVDIVTQSPNFGTDVKIPWELSRLQWLHPVGQAYLLTNDEVYAEYSKGILQSWIESNPWGVGVNWSCTMEAAMRVLSWTWLYRVFADSKAWQDNDFKLELLDALYEHLVFVERYIEISDVNGNHLIADAVSLVVGGAFFEVIGSGSKWRRTGWKILEFEIGKQVLDDGVNFEGSVSYHRFVTELLFLAVQYQESITGDNSDRFRTYLLLMASYIDAYVKPDGTAPLVGDSDNGRALDFGSNINDHRYLVHVIFQEYGEQKYIAKSALTPESLWWLGYIPLADEARVSDSVSLSSAAFTASGNFIMRGHNDYVFIDCGHVGLAGRGGHGHNDCLSFVAVLAGCELVGDTGSYIYTSNYKERQRRRGTQCHNTPMIAQQEINRFIHPDNLWFLNEDAIPSVEQWFDSRTISIFRGSHSGYLRLSPPVRPVRTIVLDKEHSGLLIRDSFDPIYASHSVNTTLQIAPGVIVTRSSDGIILLTSGNQRFSLVFEEIDSWHVEIFDSPISPSYGVLVAAQAVRWKSIEGCRSSLTIFISPEDAFSSYNYKQLLNKLNSIH